MKLGKLYIGESAGAIIASPDAEYMKSVNFDPIEKAPELKDCTSLDLVDFYTIPHYGNFPFKKKGEKIVQLYNEKLQLIPISNKQAVIIEDSNIQIKRCKMNRIDRIAAILIQLQSHSLVKAQQISERFNISIRTVYRDIRTLEEAGIPIIGNPGIGYSLAEGFKLSPLMFTQKEALSFFDCREIST